MFEEEADPQAEATDDTESVDAEDSGVADAVDQQAAASDGTAAEAAPEVPDDASDTIARAQEHIDNLNMEEERAAAKKAM
jgi:hypothetical protein